MKRSTRTLIVVVVGLVAATAASLLVYRTIRQMPTREVEVAHLYAVVASHPLTLGARITKDDVKKVAWPATSPVPGAFQEVEAVIDRGVTAPVGENEPLTSRNVAPREAGVGLAPTIPSGMRAISVRVNEVIGVAGFVVPGTRVDVMVILKRGTESVASVVASNVQVLTAGTRYDQDVVREGKALPSTVVTLMVSPDDAARIGLAGIDGQIMLTLRNPLDATQTGSGVTRASALAGGESTTSASAGAPARTEEPKRPRTRTVAAAAQPAPVAALPPPPPAVYKVETIRAAKRTEETLR